MPSEPHPTINLTIRNVGGSVEHYYHFLLGFLFPLALKHKSLQEQGFSGLVYVRSCGPMDRILREIGFPGITIIEKAEHHRNSSRDEIDGSPVMQETVFGMDFANGDYPRDSILDAAGTVRSRLVGKHVDPFSTGSHRSITRATRVLLVNRSIDPFYASSAAEIPTSGLDRRSIRNFADVRRSLETVYDEVISVVLENMTLAEQIALFSTSDLIVAQHGAALANTVWCKPGTRVVEISPPRSKKKCFPQLSRLFDLDHQLIHQDGEHGDCDIASLMKSLI